MTFTGPEQAIAYFQNLQKEIVETDKKLKELISTYKTEQKQYFGISDGEQFNILQLAEMFLRLKQ